MKIKRLNDQDLVQVAEIHQSAFPESYLSKLNLQAIIKYYAWHLRPPNRCTAIGAYQDDKMLGFCFAGTFRNAEYYFIMENWFFFFKYFISHPSAFFQLKIMARFKTLGRYMKEYALRKFKKQGQKQSVLPKRFGILAIAVSPNHQGGGVGAALMRAVEQEAIESGYDKLNLSVDPDNQQAISFYEKIGWKKVFFEKDKLWQGHMEKFLN